MMAKSNHGGEDCFINKMALDNFLLSEVPTAYSRRQALTPCEFCHIHIGSEFFSPQRRIFACTDKALEY